LELVLLPMTVLTRYFAILVLLSGCGGAPSVPADSPSGTVPSSPEPERAATGGSDAVLAPPGPASGSRQVVVEDEAPAEETPAPLPSGTRILHIGDSMAGALGIALNRQLEERGVVGKLRYETASYIPTWASSEKLRVYLAQHDPDLILISLGTNELQITEPERRAKTIRRLVSRLEGRPCVWIAPPHLDAGDNGLRDIIRANCAPCGYMNTDAVYEDMPRVSDKIHPTMAAREEWARRVIDWLAEHRQAAGDQPWALDPAVVPAAPAQE
jgi:lysophospholipase L1-like esterase